MGATVIRTSCSEGDVCGSASMCENPITSMGCENPMLVIPAGRAISAEGGMAVHQGDAK